VRRKFANLCELVCSGKDTSERSTADRHGVQQCGSGVGEQRLHVPWRRYKLFLAKLAVNLSDATYFRIRKCCSINPSSRDVIPNKNNSTH